MTGSTFEGHPITTLEGDARRGVVIALHGGGGGGPNFMQSFLDVYKTTMMLWMFPSALVVDDGQRRWVPEGGEDIWTSHPETDVPWLQRLIGEVAGTSPVHLVGYSSGGRLAYSVVDHPSVLTVQTFGATCPVKSLNRLQTRRSVILASMGQRDPHRDGDPEEQPEDRPPLLTTWETTKRTIRDNRTPTHYRDCGVTFANGDSLIEPPKKHEFLPRYAVWAVDCILANTDW